MVDKEYILCAAIHYVTGEKFRNQPTNIIGGVVVCGRRHHNCFTILAMLFPAKPYLNNHVQGFITNTDRFVDRKEAYKIAMAAKQIKPRTVDIELNEWFKLSEKDSEILTSEDLY